MFIHISIYLFRPWARRNCSDSASYWGGPRIVGGKRPVWYERAASCSMGGMCVCMYVCAYVYMHVCMVCLVIYVCICVLMYTCIPDMSVLHHAAWAVCVCVYVCVCWCIYACMHGVLIYICMHMYAYVYMHSWYKRAASCSMGGMRIFMYMRAYVCM
jgi:hypothetical protein